MPLLRGTAYVWGEVQAKGLTFAGPNAGFFKREMGFSLSWKMRARRCEACRNVQLFDPSEQ